MARALARRGRALARPPRARGGPAAGAHAYLRMHSRSARHLGSAGIGLAIAAALLPGVTGIASAAGAAAPAANEATMSQDNLRTNWDPDEPP